MSNDQEFEIEEGRLEDIPVFVHSDLDDYGLDVYEYRIYGRLARRAGRNNIARESIANMAEGCKISERQTRYALKVLVALNLVSRHEKPNAPTRFRLLPRSAWAAKEQVESIRQIALTPNPEKKPLHRTPAQPAPLHRVQPPPALYAAEGSPMKVLPSTHVHPKERKSITSASADAPICPKCRNAGKYIGNGQTLALCLNCNERFVPFGGAFGDSPKGTRQKQYNLPDDEFTAIYREAYAIETKFNYIPDGGDVDQYAKMRRDRPRLTTDMFKQATANFFLSPRKRHRLKELCVDVAEFYNSAYDKYGNPTTTVGSSIQPRKPVIPG